MLQVGCRSEGAKKSILASSPTGILPLPLSRIGDSSKSKNREQWREHEEREREKERSEVGLSLTTAESGRRKLLPFLSLPFSIFSSFFHSLSCLSYLSCLSCLFCSTHILSSLFGLLSTACLPLDKIPYLIKLRR